MGHFRAFFILIALVITPQAARADYRVFILQISDASTGQTRTVTTTLDDLQYATYYPVHPNERVSIQTHWKCRNWRSDLSQDPEQRYCPNPRANNSQGT